MRRYPAKLLLFGEHILLLGARAMAVPVPAFGGAWSEASEETPWRASLRAFAASRDLQQMGMLDTSRFQAELEAGLFFDSNIPSGYGLGSSGALCAAVYDRYAFDKTSDLPVLKQLFARMESYFHGQSSGIDPLTSYLNRALWIEDRHAVRFAEPANWQQEPPLIFLLDTHTPRQTGPLVQWFLEQSRKPDFALLLEQSLFPVHSALLEAWESGDNETFWQALRQVSAFQATHFEPMIPAALRASWEHGLQSDAYVLKVCGAGGGGFVLGFGTSKAKILSQLGTTFAPVFPFEQDAMVEK